MVNSWYPAVLWFILKVLTIIEWKMPYLDMIITMKITHLKSLELISISKLYLDKTITYHFINLISQLNFFVSIFQSFVIVLKKDIRGDMLSVVSCRWQLYPFSDIFFQKKYKHVFTIHISHSSTVSGHRWNSSLCKTRTYLFCTVNIMGADVVATQGARVSATMILTQLNQDNLVPTH